MRININQNISISSNGGGGGSSSSSSNSISSSGSSNLVVVVVAVAAILEVAVSEVVEVEVVEEEALQASATYIMTLHYDNLLCERLLFGFPVSLFPHKETLRPGLAFETTTAIPSAPVGRSTWTQQNNTPRWVDTLYYTRIRTKEEIQRSPDDGSLFPTVQLTKDFGWR